MNRAAPHWAALLLALEAALLVLFWTGRLPIPAAYEALAVTATAAALFSSAALLLAQATRGTQPQSAAWTRHRARIKPLSDEATARLARTVDAYVQGDTDGQGVQQRLRDHGLPPMPEPSPFRPPATAAATAEAAARGITATLAATALAAPLPENLEWLGLLPPLLLTPWAVAAAPNRLHRATIAAGATFLLAIAALALPPPGPVWAAPGIGALLGGTAVFLETPTPRARYQQSLQRRRQRGLVALSGLALLIVAAVVTSTAPVAAPPLLWAGALLSTHGVLGALTATLEETALRRAIEHQKRTRLQSLQEYVARLRTGTAHG